jgi:FkbM family methyltransferase
MYLSIEHRVEFSTNGRSIALVHDNADDHIFKIWNADLNFYEIEFLEFLGGFLSPASCVLDVGANVGNHTVYFAAIRGCTVWAIEPNRRALGLLHRNISINGVDRQVHVVEVAAGATSSLAGMLVPPPSGNLGEVAYRPCSYGEIRMESIDDLGLSDTLRLIKIDTEGWELPILRGAERILRRCRPLVAAELPSMDIFGQVFEFMLGQGYVVIRSFNWTPSHVFHPVQQPISQATATASRRIGEHWIESLKRREPMEQRKATQSRLIERLRECLTDQID